MLGSTLWPALALLAWLALSGLWSAAPAAVVLGQFGVYALVLSVPLVGSQLDPAWARRALRHFTVASALVALLLVVERHAGVPPSWLWHTTVDAEGNQRIANSLLLALGAAFALWHAARAVPPAHRVAWVGCAALIAVGLASQDRRTGMFVLPLLLLAWVLASRVAAARKAALVVAIVLAAGAAWQASPNVRARFDEGVAELQRYRSDDRVADSWGQRVRMVETTAAMVAEHPWRGHGLASWRLQWLQRMPPGSALSAQKTPHNEYLLLAQQAGVPALLLFGWLLGAAWWQARRAGPAGMPALMAWTALAAAACFNVALRDAKFALPLWIVLGCATAAARVCLPALAAGPSGPTTHPRLAV